MGELREDRNGNNIILITKKPTFFGKGEIETCMVHKSLKSKLKETAANVLKSVLPNQPPYL